jgi:hypothetical protein
MYLLWPIQLISLQTIFNPVRRSFKKRWKACTCMKSPVEIIQNIWTHWGKLSFSHPSIRSSFVDEIQPKGWDLATCLECLTAATVLGSIPASSDTVESRSSLNRLDIIHSRLDLLRSRLDLIPSRLDISHSRLELIHSRLDLIRSRLDLIHMQSARSHPQSARSQIPLSIVISALTEKPYTVLLKS